MRMVLATIGGLLIVYWATIIYRIWRLDGILWLIRCGVPRGRDVVLVLEKFGANLADRCDVESELSINHGCCDFANLAIGAGAHVGKGVFLDLADRIVISDKATVSMEAVILTHIDVGRSPLSS